MGQIDVEGLGVVEIKGDRPTPEETQAILDALQKRGGIAGPGTEPVPSEQDIRPRGIDELTGGMVNKPAAEMAGALTGATLATGTAIPTGPGAAVAATAGGMMGNAAGAIIYDSAESLLRYFGVLGPSRQSEKQRLEGNVQDVVIEGMFGLGAPLVRPVLATRRVLGRLFGITTEQAKAITKEAELAGVKLGALDVGNSIPKGYAKVIGIFPFSGTPIRKEFVGKQQQAEAALNKILNNSAPTVTLADELSIDMVKAAERTSKEFRNTAGRLYDSYRQAVDAGGAIIPTETIREFGQGVADKLAETGIRLRNGETLPRPAMDEVTEFVAELRQLPDTITVKQYDSLVQDLQQLIDKNEANRAALRTGVQAKKSLEVDFHNPVLDELDEGTAAAIVSARDAASKFYAKGMVLFEMPTAKKITRADKNLFRNGPVRQGTINADEVANYVVNLRSPAALNDLRALVGDDLMNQAARKRLGDAADQSFETIEVSGQNINVLNTEKFSRLLGLTGPKAAKEKEGLKALMKTTGVSVDDLESFIRSVDRIQKAGSASQFITRRVTLGGLGAITAAAGVGGAAVGAGASVGTLAAAAVLGMLARFGSSAISSPTALKSMQTALDKQVSQSIRQQAIARLGLALQRDLFAPEVPRKIQIMPGP